MNFIYNLFIKSQLFVALCATLLCVFFQQIYQVNYIPHYLVTFLSTFCVYNFALWELKKKDTWRVMLIVVSLVLAIGIGVYYFNKNSLVLLSCLALVSLAYSLPWSRKGLRWIPFVKTFLIALVWACVVVLLPFLQSGSISLGYGWDVNLFAVVFLFILGITIPFDIRDMHNDLSELRTLPQVLGLQKARALAVFFILLSMLFFFWNKKAVLHHQIIFSITCITAIGLSIGSSPKRNKWYYAFWMESLSALPILLLWMYEWLFLN